MIDLQMGHLCKNKKKNRKENFNTREVYRSNLVCHKKAQGPCVSYKKAQGLCICNYFYKDKSKRLFKDSNKFNKVSTN